MGMVSALTPALRKEATLLAEKLGISVEEAVAKYFSKTEQKLIPGQRLLPGKTVGGQTTLPPAKAKSRLSDSVGEAYPPLDKSSSKEFPGGLTDRIRNSEQGFRVSEPDVAADKSLAPIYKVPQYEEKGLVPVKPNTGFTFKDSPNMDAELVPETLRLGPASKRPISTAGENYEGSLPKYEADPSAPGMSLSKKLALGAAAAGTAASAGQLLYNPANPADQRLFNPENFAKAPEEAAPTNTSETSEIVNSITPPAGKTEVIPPSQAEKSLRAATQAYNSIQYKAPESTTKDLRSKLEEAYNSKITRNDWAELATTLANAVAQYGSAHQAGDKYSGGIKFAPGVDYGARSDRAFKEYSRATDAADKTDAAKERGSLQEHQSRMDVLRGKTDLAKLDVDMERERARTAAASQSELGKMTDREKETSRREDAATERSSAETKVDRETISKMDQYRNLSKAIQDAKGTAKDRLISQRAKLSTGLSADQEAAAIAGAEKSRGLFNPFTPESSPESEQAALDAAIAQQKAVIGSRIASRQGGAVQPPASSTGKTDQQPVTVKHKSTGQTRQFPAGSVELQNALQNPEFEIVR